MKVFTLRREQVLPGTPEEVFPFFADARNLEAITPPLLRFEVVTPGEIPMRVGTLIQYRLTLRGISLNWLTSIQEWEPSRRFVDVQVRGPYALWHHTHEFAAHGERETLMTDTVRYASTAGRASAAGTPNAISTPAIPPLTVPGSGSVLATCPRKYARVTTASAGGEPKAWSIAHRTAASNPQ